MNSGDPIVETALSWRVAGDWVPAIVAAPAHQGAGPSNPVHSGLGVVIVVGGPQYRVGSHRQFVLLARHLAALGHVVMRFDLRGLGDAEGAFAGFESIGPEIDAAVEALYRQSHHVRQHVLWGLCDAASAILMRSATHADDRRLAGVCLLNPWVRTPQGLDRSHIKHYYRRRLLEPEFWKKLMRGGVPLAALREFAAKWHRIRGRSQARSLSFIEQMREGWRSLQGKILLITSENDLTGLEFLDLAGTAPEWQGCLSPQQVQHITIAGADHTFSRASWRDEVASATLAWLDQLAHPAPAKVPDRG